MKSRSALNIDVPVQRLQWSGLHLRQLAGAGAGREGGGGPVTVDIGKRQLRARGLAVRRRGRDMMP
jgi:hypothetical protein